MVKEIKIFEASDGKQFKTKQGAENHEKRIAINSILEKLDMTEDEITNRLNEVSEWNSTIKNLLKIKDWKKWSPHLIGQINEKLLKDREKITYYYSPECEQVGKEKGDEFTDQNKYSGDDYEVRSIKDVNSHVKEIYLRYKTSWEDRIKIKLDNNESLKEHEISELMDMFPIVHEEKVDEGRWESFMFTVVDILGDNYGIDWSRGLTEMQENAYYEQPYKVMIEEKEVTVTKTIITRI